ncbi:FAD-dependent pyridine nucleotide-disulfide oxidoreductase [Marinobacter lipolyticus SM19]|uniref:FAD-dependent pyridine nucleotide-disulfide oxidoreductase n=1 Tax=Marinobacter lipolyticus SM19 TaxID=1318628 RepID=R8B0U2_9GAMM|nr:FAD-dependent oxidoreductase [Marinobacter lipolyticus]EON92208.1 FAD-dependent pyridine nucleotide-disulfide oxidoreductase [Marinobacter lipolyticus SM19]
MNTGAQQTLVICGHGMVAQRLLEKLVAQPHQPFSRIVVFNGEASPAYNRIQLSALLAGDAKESSLVLKQSDWFRQHNIEIHQGDPVTAINRIDKTVTTTSGLVQEYDRLVIATGSRSASLGIQGEEMAGVVGFRDLRDTRKLINISQRHRRAVVIGGGFLGLEAAEGLRSRGMSVTVLHRSSHLLNRQLDPTGGALLEDALTARGLTIRTRTSPVALLGRDSIRAVQLDDETLISTDLVVIAAGISPNAQLARDAGLDCDRAIRVDTRLRTSDPTIYAIGECCQISDQTFGLVEPGYQQAEVLAQVLCDANSDAAFEPSVIPTRLKISGIPIFSCGQTQPDGDTESVVWQDYETNRYCRLLIRNQRLTGAVLFGETTDGLWYSERIQQADDISPIRAHLAFGKHYCDAA